MHRRVHRGMSRTTLVDTAQISPEAIQTRTSSSLWPLRGACRPFLYLFFAITATDHALRLATCLGLLMHGWPTNYDPAL